VTGQIEGKHIEAVKCEPAALQSPDRVIETGSVNQHRDRSARFVGQPAVARKPRATMMNRSALLGSRRRAQGLAQIADQSSMDSMPTINAHVLPIPARELAALICGASCSRVYDQGFGVAHVRQVAHEAQRFDEFGPPHDRLDPKLITIPRREGIVGELMVRVARQTRINTQATAALPCRNPDGRVFS